MQDTDYADDLRRIIAAIPPGEILAEAHMDGAVAVKLVRIPAGEPEFAALPNAARWMVTTIGPAEHGNTGLHVIAEGALSTARKRYEARRKADGAYELELLLAEAV